MQLLLKKAIFNRPLRLAYLLLFSSALFWSALMAKESQEQPLPEKLIYSVEIKGAITPSTMEELNRAIEKAENDRALGLIVLLNTPGGMMHSMDEMCRNILNSTVPVMTFVYPPGSYAGSAGVYIMYASHLAAMAPATNIGSATPVTMGGGEKDDKKSDRIPDVAGTDDAQNMKRKLMNHAKAQIRSFAEFHDRNISFAERSITHAENITSRKAYKIKAIDLIAASPEDLLARANGRTVRMIGGKKQLNLEGAIIRKIESDFRSQFLAIITHPAVVNLLMMIGVLGIMAEIQYPGAVFPGVVGAICLILGLYAMQSLPINYAGMGLILLGVIFFILEIKVISYGMLTVAGIVSLVIGSILLARSGDELMWDTLFIILSTSVIFIVIMVFIIYKAKKVMETKPVSGMEALSTEFGVAETEITETSGQIYIHSELWSARTAKPGQTIASGQRVRVTDREGLLLFVEPASRTEPKPESDGP